MFAYLPGVSRVLCLLPIAVPLVLGPPSLGWRTTALLIVLVMISVVVAATVYDYAFISVECFFVAVLTGYLCLLFHRLPANSPASLQVAHK